VANVENVVVTKFRADITDLQKGLDRVQGELKGMRDQAESATGGFTTLKGAVSAAVGIAAVQLVNNFASSLKNLATDSFNAAARVEELEIVTDAVGKATGVGAKAIRDATTAIRANGIELAAAQGVALEFARNNLELADSSKIARVAQDLAVISGQNSTETTQLLTQAIITGRTQLLKSAHISTTAEMGYQKYAEALGKGVHELSATEKQQAIVNLILEEGQKVTGVYEASMTSAGKVMRSFARIINDIQIEVGGVLTAAFGPMILALYDLLKAFSLTLREGGALRPMLDAITGAMKAVGKPIVDLIKFITNLITNFEDIQKESTFISEIFQMVKKTADELRLAFNGLNNFGKQLAAQFGGPTTQVLTFLAKVTLKFLITQVSALVQGIAFLGKMAATIFVGVANEAIKMANGVIKAVNVFYQLTGQTEKMIQPLELLTLSFDGAKQASGEFRDSMEYVDRSGKKAKKSVDEFGKGTKDTGKEVDEAAERLKKMQDAFNDLSKGANSARDDLGQMTRSVYGELTDLQEALQPERLNIKGVIKLTDDLMGLGEKIIAPLKMTKVVGQGISDLAKQVERDFKNLVVSVRDNFARLLKERESIETALKDNETSYRDRIKDINRTFDALDKEASARVKSLEAYYANLIKGLRTQLDGATKAFNEADSKLKELVADRKRTLDGIAKGFRGFLNALSFKRAAEIAGKGVKDTGKVIETTVKDLGNGIRVTIQRELQPAMEELSQMGTDVPITAGEIRAQLQERLDAIRDFASNIRTLVSKGLDASLIKEFTEAGVSGAGDVVSALAGASQEEIAQINAVQGQLAAQVTEFTQFASAQWYDASIAQQEAVVAPLRASYEEAQTAVNNAEILRQAELTAAQAQVDILREQRQAAIAQADADYEAQRIALEAKRDQVDASIRDQAAILQDAMKKFGDKTVEMMEWAGNASRQKFKEGFNKKFPDMKARLNQMMTDLANSMRRTTEIEVVTRHRAEYVNASPRAMGGPVAAREAYLVGERGPELFMPNLAGQILPAGETARALRGMSPNVGSMSFGGGGGGSASYQINVNVPLTANQAEIGRQVVDAIKAYERRNGRVYEPA
jgi:archaellum component FlaC